MIAHLTNSVAPRYAPDISGVSTTVMQVAAAIGVTGFGTAYQALAVHPGADEATRAFALVTGAFAAAAVLAALAAYRATATRQ